MTASPHRVRPAEPADAAAIAGLHADVFAEAWSASTICRLISAPGAIALITVCGVDARGFLIAQTAADEAEILTVGVAKTAQRQGLAGTLIAALLERARHEGLAQIFLDVAEDNTAARALYGRHGFAVAGRRRGYYVRDGGKVDALLMRRSLGPEGG